MQKPSLLISACDDVLAGIFVRRFSREGWDVVVVDGIKDAEYKAVKMRPSIFLLDTSCAIDVANAVKRLHALPTLRKTKIVLLSERADMPSIRAGLAAGASEYVLTRHVIPAEVVTKMKKLIGA